MLGQPVLRELQQLLRSICAQRCVQLPTTLLCGSCCQLLECLQKLQQHLLVTADAGVAKQRHLPFTVLHDAACGSAAAWRLPCTCIGAEPKTVKLHMACVLYEGARMPELLQQNVSRV